MVGKLALATSSGALQAPRDQSMFDCPLQSQTSPRRMSVREMVSVGELMVRVRGLVESGWGASVAIQRPSVPAVAVDVSEPRETRMVSP